MRFLPRVGSIVGTASKCANEKEEGKLRPISKQAASVVAYFEIGHISAFRSKIILGKHGCGVFRNRPHQCF